MGPDNYHPLADDKSPQYKEKHQQNGDNSSSNLVTYIAIAAGFSLAAGLYFGYPYIRKLDTFLENNGPGGKDITDTIRDTVGGVDSSK